MYLSDANYYLHNYLQIFPENNPPRPEKSPASLGLPFDSSHHLAPYGAIRHGDHDQLRDADFAPAHGRS